MGGEQTGNAPTSDRLEERLRERAGLWASWGSTDAIPYLLTEAADALSAARARNTQLEEALRPFAEKWDLHALDYLADHVDGAECRIIEARVVEEMLADIKSARSVLGSAPPEKTE